MNDKDYQELRATVRQMERLIGKANTVELLETLTQWSGFKKDLLLEFLGRYREDEAELSGSMADVILGPEDRRKYNACLSVIADCYSRMATNRDTAYRTTQMQLVDRKLERMTVLLEQGDREEAE